MNLAQRHLETETHWFTSLKVKKKSRSQIVWREKMAGSSWEYQGSLGGSNTRRQNADCVFWSPACGLELPHQHQGKCCAGERAIKARPGSHNCCWPAGSGKPWCQGNTAKGIICIGFGLGHTATLCLSFPICRIPLFTGSVWASQLMLTRGSRSGIMVTQTHHKDSAFRKKKCFLLTALPTNSQTNSQAKDLFCWTNIFVANIKAWPQPWWYRTLVMLMSLQFTAIGKQIKLLFAEEAVHLYAPVSQGHTSPGNFQLNKLLLKWEERRFLSCSAIAR